MSELEGKVVKVLDIYTLVVNLGKDHGVKNGDRFLIYTLGEEIFDPDTNESLGQIELVKGEGQAIHVQDRLTTIKSSNKKMVERSSSALPFSSPEYRAEVQPFDEPILGDYARLR